MSKWRLRKVNKLKPKYKKLSDKELQIESANLKQRVQDGEKLNKIAPEAFALCREACTRVLGKTPYDVQILGGFALHDGKIAEMKTGEGKTLTEVLPAYLNALDGRGVHIITVNDYLAERDMEEMAKLFEFLGLTVDRIYPDMPNLLKKRAYQADILYGTNSEFGFDYLRDNLAQDYDQVVQRPLNYVIIDEVDSVLIDDARTPLIISGQTNQTSDYYILADTLARRLEKGKSFEETSQLEKMLNNLFEDEEIDGDYIVDKQSRSVHLTQTGIKKVEDFFNIKNLGDPENILISHYVQQALKAHATMKINVDYLVHGDEVLIIDESTGRTMEGRRYSDGLHQALEAKEGLSVKPEDRTHATITLQNYFKLYNKISGMTGTAKTEKIEFKTIYGLDVVEIPTNKPVIRKDHKPVVYLDLKEKYEGVLLETLEEHRKGRPVLIGTATVEQSEILSRLFDQRAIKHEVLNAKNHEREASIIAQAGKSFSVTIATNMAGRGTDIILGGNPEILALEDLKKQTKDELVIRQATSLQKAEDPEVRALQVYYFDQLEKYKKETQIDKEIVLEAGGLHVIGTQLHDSVRVDNQLKGRAGRQGDPGSSRFHLSLEDEMVQVYGSYQIKMLYDKFKEAGAKEINVPGIVRYFEMSQKAVESNDYENRKSVFEYDQIDDIYRSEIYDVRQRLLVEEDMSEEIDELVNFLSDAWVDIYDSEELKEALEKPINWLRSYNPNVEKEISLNIDDYDNVGDLNDLMKVLVKNKRKQIAEYDFNVKEVEKRVYLGALDDIWAEFLVDSKNLQDSVAMTGFGTQKPIDNYKVQLADRFDLVLIEIAELFLTRFLNLEFQLKQDDDKESETPEKVKENTDKKGGN